MFGYYIGVEMYLKCHIYMKNFQYKNYLNEKCISWCLTTQNGLGIGLQRIYVINDV